MNPENNEIRIDIKAIGRSIGRRIPNKPNVGKNPKDGDGDGFVVDLTTGLDNVPFKPIRQIDGSGSDRNPMVAGVPVRPGGELERLINEVTASRDTEKIRPNLRDGDVDRGKRERVQKRYSEYRKRGGTMSFDEWSRRDAGRNPKDHRVDNPFARRHNRMDDADRAIAELGRSQRNQKSFSPMDLMSHGNESMRIRLTDDEDAELEPRQRIMYEFFELIAKKMGKWTQDSGPDGAHYMEEHPFGDKGMKCINCSFFQGGNRCEIVVGEIKPEAICKLWVIRKDLVKD